MEISTRSSGTATATGNVTMKMDPVGFFDGAGVVNVFTGGMWRKTATVRWSGSGSPGGTVKLKGCVGDPSVTGNWYDLSSTTGGLMSVTGEHDFVRLNVSAYTSGTAHVQLSASGI